MCELLNPMSTISVTSRVYSVLRRVFNYAKMSPLNPMASFKQLCDLCRLEKNYKYTGACKNVKRKEL